MNLKNNRGIYRESRRSECCSCSFFSENKTNPFRLEIYKTTCASRQHQDRSTKPPVLSSHSGQKRHSAIEASGAVQEVNKKSRKETIGSSLKLDDIASYSSAISKIERFMFKCFLKSASITSNSKSQPVTRLSPT
jgi:hypothetical protein